MQSAAAHLHALQHNDAGWAGLQECCQAALEQARLSAPPFARSLRSACITPLKQCNQTGSVCPLLAEPVSQANTLLLPTEAASPLENVITHNTAACQETFSVFRC